MNHEKLNNLVFCYQETKDEETARSIHDIITKEWDRTNAFDRLSNIYGLSRNDVESNAYNCLFNALDPEVFRDGRSKFFNLLGRMLSNACKDDVGKLAIFRRADSTEMETQDSGGDGTFSVLDVTGSEDEDIKDFEIKSDQRQLIAELASKADEKCRQALNAFLQTDNAYEAGKLLGVRNVTVENRIKKLARYFDVNKWGDVSQYLTNSDVMEDDIIYPYVKDEREPDIPEEMPVKTYHLDIESSAI